MLILTRKAGQSIRIGDKITLVVLEAAGNTMRIGIDAPREVPVHREEIYMRIQAEGVSLEEISPEEVTLETGAD